VNRNQREVHVRVHHPVGGPLTEEGLQNGEALARPSQLKAEQHGHKYPNDAHEHSRYQELLGNHLVIDREDVLRPEVVYVMLVIVVVVVSVIVSVVVSVVGHNS